MKIKYILLIIAIAGLALAGYVHTRDWNVTDAVARHAHMKNVACRRVPLGEEYNSHKGLKEYHCTGKPTKNDCYEAFDPGWHHTLAADQDCVNIGYLSSNNPPTCYEVISVPRPWYKYYQGIEVVQDGYYCG